ncbi:MAG: 16S rRNA (cytosine(1402)-N(4))-methyltransferase RsmH [Cocleimonas sp.]|nr:16S rRNA (cytosine(1402)-N(4))-methyltransferase RsmH [Cocleimonas sp.]
MSDLIALDFQHTTVLLKEAVEALSVKQDGFYIDATFGRGGHSNHILEYLGANGKLLLIDKDPEAIAHAQKVYEDDQRVIVWQGSFKDFPLAQETFGLDLKLDGLLLDLGVSSPQLDDASRGFSFQRDGDLDMRMNPEVGESASEWLNQADEDEIATVLWQFGEERFSRRIARAILKERERLTIQTTLRLAGIIAAAIPKAKQKKGKHPATRSFQAIRIFINKELDDLLACLEQTLASLAKNGRVVVISFHSLEDRIVKRFFKEKSRGPQLPRGFPVRGDPCLTDFKLVGKAIKASSEEIESNPRSRSAIMRVGENTA